MSLGRRAFLRALAALGAGPATALARSSAPALRWGLQLYTVRALLARDLDATLTAVAALGYREVEFVGHDGRDARTLRRALDAAGLVAPSVQVRLDALRAAAVGATLDHAAAVGHRWVVLGWLAPAERRFGGHWRTVAEVLTAAGAAASARGMRVAYHHHDFEFAPLGATTGWDALTGTTDAALVDLEVDTYWAAVAGRDPAALLRAHAGRVRLVHLKDVGPDRAFCDVGAGTLDWRTILAAARDAGVEHRFVEHDAPTDPWASARSSLAYLRRIPA
jgi:sugar phosphate isomerase/epimerase